MKPRRNFVQFCPKQHPQVAVWCAVGYESNQNFGLGGNCWTFLQWNKGRYKLKNSLQGWNLWTRFAGESKHPVYEFGILWLSQGWKTVRSAGLAWNLWQPHCPWRLSALPKSGSRRVWAMAAKPSVKELKKRFFWEPTNL